MPLYQHPLFTIDLSKVTVVYQEEDQPSVIICTDDQRKIEIATDSPEAATELLNDLQQQWDRAVGPLLCHGLHAVRADAIYSIQAEGEEVSIYVRDHSVSFEVADAQQALALLAELTSRWQLALGEKPQ